MPLTLKAVCMCLWLACCYSARGQGTFVYDQQSSTDESTPAFGSGVTIQTADPYGQSFKPSLSSVNFVRLKLNDNDPGSGTGATLFVQLHTDSMTGAILGSTVPVSLANGFAGTVNFLFDAPVTVVPGGTYVFETVVQSGEPWNLDAHELNYPGGTAIFQGLALPGSDFWFREGIIIPEPSTSILMLAGVAALARVFSRRRRGRT